MSGAGRPDTPPPPGVYTLNLSLPKSLMPMTLPLPSFVPPPPSAEYKKVEEYVEMLKDENKGYIDELQKEAQAIFAKRGPLCDSEGFYQHSGECWNDSLQQILCNADTIKERVQSVLIHEKFDTVAEMLQDNELVPHSQNPIDFIIANYDEIQIQKQWIGLYILELQKRFLRHYITEGGRRQLAEELCKTEGEEVGEIALKKFAELSRITRARKAGAEGERAAIFGKSNSLGKKAENVYYRKTREEHQRETIGGKTEEVYVLLRIMNTLFFPDEPFERQVYSMQQLQSIASLSSSRADFEALIDNTSGVWLNIQDPIMPGKGHSIAFYECGEGQYIFDDNIGAMEYRWDALFKYYMELSSRALFPSVKFTKLFVQKLGTQEHFYFDLYPIVEYVSYPTGKYRYILFGTEIFELSGEEDKFTLEALGYRIVGKIDPGLRYRIAEFILFGKKSAKVANTNYEIMYTARIKHHPLYWMLVEGDEDMALEYIEKNPVIPDLTTRHWDGDVPILITAIKSNKERAAIALVEKGYNADFSYKKITPIMWAAIFGMKGLYKLLLDRRLGLDFEELGNKLIHSLASSKEPYFTEELLKAGVDVNTLSAKGRTALIFATEYNNLDLMKVLCSAGADPSIRDLGNPERGTPPSTAMDYAKTEEAREILRTCGSGSKATSGGRRRRTRREKRKAHRRRRTVVRRRTPLRPRKN